jgi:putative flavoprotein involved in K+ transport
MTDHVYDAIVVGAGQAGISVSCHLQRLGIDHLLLDRGRAGETWRTQRWDSFVLNTPNSLNSLPGTAMKPENPGGFESASVLVDYFDSHVSAQQLPFRHHTDVTAVQRSTTNGHFVVETSDAFLKTRNIIAASGAQNVPSTPKLSADVPSGILSIHSSEFRNFDNLPAGSVLVVGSGKSGSQITEDLLQSGKKVYLATSRVGRARRRFRGIDAFECMQMMGYLAQTPDDLDDASTQFSTQPVFTGANGGHTLSLQRLWRNGATLLGRLEAFNGSKAKFKDNLHENIEFADEISAFLLAKIEEALGELVPDAPPLEHDLDDQPDAEVLQLVSPSEIDLVEAGISTIIWATGFSADYSWLKVDGAIDDEGFPAHDGGVSGADGVFFMGVPWLRTRGSLFIVGANADSSVIAESVAERVSRNGH